MQLPQAYIGLLNCSILDDPYVKFEKRRSRVQEEKRFVNSVKFANFKISFLLNQLQKVAIN